jgi:Protein of unknown function (DUF1501)
MTRFTRRTFLSSSGVGLGSVALNLLLARDLRAKDSPDKYRGLAGFPHHAPKVKRVIFLYMSGGPSHLETFDFKPKLAELDGKPMPESFTKGQPIAQLQGQTLKVQGPLTKFQQYGKAGHWVSDFLPYHAKLADDICVIKSMVTDQINHDPAHTMMNTGTAISGRPSIGSWVTYGLGSESEDLPGFVVMTSFAGRSPQPISQRMWANGFLPSRFQGVEFNSSGDPVYYVRNPKGVSDEQQHELVDAVKELDRHRNEAIKNPEVDTRIQQYEMAFRMQASVPELMDISKEPKETLELYGAKPGDGSFASNCLLARRLAERGVRFIQLYHMGWDHHTTLPKQIRNQCRDTDQPSAALIQDLKQRGLLDDTLVIWGGEFGRLPTIERITQRPGRDHNPHGFSIWMAGGGLKPGFDFGNTDDLGYAAVGDKITHSDVHATILHLLGLDYRKLTFEYEGRQESLIGVNPARVIGEIVA